MTILNRRNFLKFLGRTVAVTPLVATIGLSKTNEEIVEWEDDPLVNVFTSVDGGYIVTRSFAEKIAIWDGKAWHLAIK